MARKKRNRNSRKNKFPHLNTYTSHTLKYNEIKDKLGTDSNSWNVFDHK